MPLIDPVTMSSKKDDSANVQSVEPDHNAASDSAPDQTPSEEQKQEWQTKLMGKSVKDEDHSEINFAKRDLPKVCRVVPPGHMMTRDYVPNRMNVHVGEDETVHNVTFG